MIQWEKSRRTWRAMLWLVSLAPWTVAAAQSSATPNTPVAQANLSASAQTPGAELPSFEVASIKPSRPGAQNHNFSARQPGYFRVINMTARRMIEFAYNAQDFQVTGGPGWVDSQQYSVEAKVPDTDVPVLQAMPADQKMQQMGLMLRSLLQQRFKLKLSRAVQQKPVYALIVAKEGPKLTPTKWQAPGPNAAQLPPSKTPHLNMGPASISAVDQPVSALCDLLMAMPELEGRRIVDQTGLEGRYDYTLLFSSDALNRQITAGKGVQMPPPDDSVPSIFTALQEQLGLRLEDTKGPVDIYTIDHIEEPSEN
jgi:uncharacterized protein (TIGR03435 family)